MKKKIIIDTDPAMGTKGGDPEDCFAIMLALNSPEIEVLGITTVQGNVPVERGYSNAKFLVEELNKEIPVHTGKPGTYDEKRNSKRLWLAGREEMEQITPMIVPLENEASAESFITETCKNNSGDIELVTIGPLTNVAKALDEDPNLSKHINKITMMAGAAQVPGNVTPAAEFNVWADPEAASKVFGSGIAYEKITLSSKNFDNPYFFTASKLIFWRLPIIDLLILGNSGGVQPNSFPNKLNKFNIIFSSQSGLNCNCLLVIFNFLLFSFPKVDIAPICFNSGYNI